MYFQDQLHPSFTSPSKSCNTAYLLRYTKVNAKVFKKTPKNKIGVCDTYQSSKELAIHRCVLLIKLALSPNSEAASIERNLSISSIINTLFLFTNSMLTYAISQSFAAAASRPSIHTSGPLELVFKMFKSTASPNSCFVNILVSRFIEASFEGVKTFSFVTPK
jgi:hypothetical protein